MVGKVLILAVRLYQKIVSPLLPKSCRFWPTCSEYAIEAIQKYGAVKGVFKTTCRLMKCHPFHPGGFDPV